MVLTLDKLFNEPEIINAIVDRATQTEKDEIFWQRHLSFEETASRTFKSYIGTVSAVKMGSVIDRNSRKPLRERQSLGSGFGEVAILGNSFQLDIDRLDLLNEMIKRYNARGANQATAMDEIVNFIVDDIRQATLAPHKRMDYVVGQLRSTGKAQVKFGDNKEGIELIDIEIPVNKKTATSGADNKIVSYLRGITEELRPKVGRFAVMEMSRKTFNDKMLKSTEFKDMYKMVLGTAELAVSGGLLTDAMASTLFTGIGLPPIRIVEEFVQKEDGTTVNAFADDKIALLPAGELGKMRWHTPYEITDPVPNKVYTPLAGGHFISTQRTDEGRFIEYMAEWMPDIRVPQQMAIIDVSAVHVS